MNYKTLDQEELKRNRTIPALPDLTQLTKIEKIIKALAWISILIVIIFISHEIINPSNISILHYNEVAFSIEDMFFPIICLSIPLVYIYHWNKTVKHLKEEHSVAFQKTSNIIFDMSRIAIIVACLWLFCSLYILLINELQVVFRFAFAFLLILNNGLQLWYYRKTFLINRDYRNLLLD